MTSVYQMQNSTIIAKLEEIIREQAKGNNSEFLKMIDNIINWNEIFILVINQIKELAGSKYENTDVVCLIKCLIIGKVFNVSDGHLPFEIADRNSYQNFIGIKSTNDIPDSEIISSFKEVLLNYGAYDEILDMFYEMLLKEKFNIIGDTNGKEYNNDSRFENHIVSKEDNFDNKINEIESRIKKLYEKKLPLNLRGIDNEKSIKIKEKLKDVKDQVEKLTNGKNSTEIKDNSLVKNGNAQSNKDEVPSQLYHKLMNIEKRINNIQNIALPNDAELNESEKIEDIKRSDNKEEELYKNLFDSFYKSLEDKGIVLKPVSKNNEVSDIKENVTVSSSYKEDKKPVESGYASENKLNPNVETIELETPEPDVPELLEEQVLEKEDVIKKGDRIHEAFVITPKAKREGIFNDANLTEDYELGYRFYKLGFKTGFFNLKLDKSDEASRIATAEFFPNSFWACVKQRSRWIAGICFQNWKANKWSGNLATKYFLFRDRKSLFSFFGAFLSNLVFLYLVYALICNIFHIHYVFSLVGHSSVLWYLMIANLIFMISRASHRFIFTYNWYGFKYAFFSFFRLLLDTFVNFFAIMRSFNVYKKTKKKVVWDSTSHY